MAKKEPERDRRALIESVRTWSSVDDVTEALVAASQYKRSVYVERSGGQWRWSPASKGGAYPLLRETARFLQVDHRAIYIKFRTKDGYAIIDPEPPARRKVHAYGFFSFERANSPAMIRLLLATLEE